MTNKHVLEEADVVSALCHNEDLNNPGYPSEVVATMMFNIKNGIVFYHPDQNVDLCAVPIGPILMQARDAGTPLFYGSLNSDIIPEDDARENFDAIEDVTMVCCPNGLFDEINSVPLVRRGITASAIGRKFNGKGEFVVDMACFPGSSGSPIFIFDRMGYYDKKENVTKMGSWRLVFVGILYSGPLITNKGTITLGVTPSIEVASMMHLGNAMRSSRISEVCNQIAIWIKNREANASPAPQ